MPMLCRSGFPRTVVSHADTLQVRFPPNEGTTGVLLGRTGVLRVVAMATALGIALSFGCCRCHDRCLVAAPSGKGEDHAE
jgi:hypothetical protein